MEGERDRMTVAANNCAGAVGCNNSEKARRSGHWQVRTEASATYARAAALAVKANQLPDIFQGKMNAIAAALREGTYEVSPEQTANAIISELRTRNATAA
jgi:anti-sigma28 factor (negative regulator of flagellin synthesis)